MKIIEFALDHSRTFIAVLFFLIIAGTSTYLNIPKEAAPDVNIPYIYTIKITHKKNIFS